MAPRRVAASLLSVLVTVGTCPTPGWSGESPTVDRQHAGTSSTVTQEQLQQLPLGRNYAELAKLAPGIQDNKDNPHDSVNWNSSRFSPVIDPLIDGLARRPRGGEGVNATELESVDPVNYLSSLREWPSEARGINGTLIATGKSGRTDMAVLYSPDGVPFGSFARNDLKHHPESITGLLQYGCDITGGDLEITTLGDFITAAKLGLLSDGEIDRGLHNLKTSGQVTGNALTSGKYRLLSDAPRRDNSSGPSAVHYDQPQTSYLDDLSLKNYKLTPQLNYTGFETGPRLPRDRSVYGGGMTQIDPPATPLPHTEPATSILDELEGAVPLNPHQPAGTPETQTNQDGTSVRTWRDGTREITRPDGSQDVTFPDGSTFHRNPDGSMVDTDAGGHRTLRDKDGKVTGTTQVRPPNEIGPEGGPRVDFDHPMSGSKVETTPSTGKQPGVNPFSYGTMKHGANPAGAEGRQAYDEMFGGERVPSLARDGAAAASQIRENLDQAMQEIQSLPLAATAPVATYESRLATLADELSSVETLAAAPGGAFSLAPPPQSSASLGATAPPKFRATSASTTDADGNTVTIAKQPNGTTTRTVTDRGGNVVSQTVVEPPPVTKPGKKPQGPRTSASTVDEQGNTVTIEKTPDAKTVRTVTGPDGTELDREEVTPPPPTKPAPRQPGTTSASTTNPDGTTTTVTRAPDGAKTVTVTDANGHVISQGPLQPEPVTKVPPRQPGHTSASTTDADGNTITIEKQPDGSMTRTITNPDGQVVSSSPVEQPPVTKPKPRKPGSASASATDERGNTITVEKQPDGSSVRTVTNPQGQVLERTQRGGTGMTPEQVQAQTYNQLIQSTDALPLEITPQEAAAIKSGKPALSPIKQKTGGPRAKDGAKQEQKPNKPSGVVTDQDAADALARLAGQAVLGGNEEAANILSGITPFLSKAGTDAVIDSALHQMGGSRSIVDELEQAEQTLPLNPHQPKGDPTIETLPNGGTLRRWADGTREVNNPDGSVNVTYPDGSTFTRGTDGTMVDRAADGSEVRRDADGKVTGRTPSQPAQPPGTPPQLIYGQDRFKPYFESGVKIGDTWHTNLGTYKDGEHPILDQGQSTYQTGFFYIPGTDTSLRTDASQRRTLGKQFLAPQTGTGHVGHGWTSGLGLEHSVDAYRLPNHWTPQHIAILPYGCSHSDKPDVIDYISEMWDEPEWYVEDYIYATESIFWRSVQEPNDPLFYQANKPKSRKAYSVGQELVTPNSSPAEGRIRSKRAEAAHAVDQWGLQKTGFTDTADPNSAWNQVESDQPNTVVAIIDSGLDTAHPDGPTYLWINQDEIPGNGKDDDGNGYVDDIHGWNFLDENADLTDYKGHGTLVAGIIAAKRNNHVGIAGINPGAQIMVLKVTDQYGKTNSLNIYRAIHYAADQGARVINISLGDAGVSKLEQLAINYAHTKGAVVVIAAGNQAGDLAGYGPGAARRAITVGMTTMESGAVHTLSNRGVNLAIAAPGEEIFSLHSKDAEWTGASTERERRFIQATGTSFAAPIVAATASLIIAKDPKQPNCLVEDALMDSAQELGTPGWDPDSGAGVLDASQALSFDLHRALTVQPTEVVVARDKKRVRAVKVFGVVRGIFASYRVELGKGKNPKEWQPVGAPHHHPVQYGLICALDAATLKSSKEWTVRITATAPTGETRVASVPITL